MAAEGLGIDQESFCCAICLDLLKDPVTIPCGHSYCMSCVNTHWNGEVGKQSYSCPQCRQNFTQRPVLVKNTMLALLMEGLKKSGPPAAPVSHCSAAHGDVSCDLCSGNKGNAVKSCLQCLVSYCKEHLQPHYDVAALKKHKLVEPTENLQDNICSRHAEVMKMFCRTDQQCICYLCSVDEHKDHDIVTAAAEKKEKQKELEDFKKKILQRIERKEENVLSLQLELRDILTSADHAMDYSNQARKELISLVEKRITELKMQIRSKQEAGIERANELQGKLQREVTDLKRKHTELDSLSHTEDHVQFLNKFASIPKVSETSEFYTSMTFPPLPHMVTLLLSELEGKILPPTVVEQPKDNPPGSVQNAPDEWPALPPQNLKLKPTASAPQVLQPNTSFSFQHLIGLSWQELKKYDRKITWDQRTVNDKLLLSEKNLHVKHMPYLQNHRKHQTRFTDVPQVVSKETLHDCSYWKVDINSDKATTVAVAYKNIRRDGSSKDCSFGKNDKSWALEVFPDQKRCVFWHNGNKVELKIPRCLNNIVGVFTDYKAGILSFYQTSETVLIYTVKTTFTQPLVAGVRLEGICNSAEIWRPSFCLPNDDADEF